MPTHRRPHMILATLALIATLLVTLVGCEMYDHIADYAFRPAADITPAAPYPADATRGRALDIQLDRDGYVVSLHNRTPATLTDVDVWLNQEFYRRFDRIEIGENGEFPLEEFVNEHGEPFPTGDFFSPEKSIPLIKADLVSGGTIHALIVRLEDEWQRPIIR